MAVEEKIAEDAAENVAEDKAENVAEDKAEKRAIKRATNGSKSKKNTSTKKRLREKQSVYNRAKFDGLTMIFREVIIVLLLVRIVYFLMDIEEGFSFATLLEVLQNAPVIDADKFLTLFNYTIEGNWGIFDFVRDFLNFFPAILNLGLTCIHMLWNVLVYLWYFVRILFGNNGI